jgi:hypothetical protein
MRTISVKRKLSVIAVGNGRVCINRFASAILLRSWTKLIGFGVATGEFAATIGVVQEGALIFGEGAMIGEDEGTGVAVGSGLGAGIVSVTTTRPDVGLGSAPDVKVEVS